MRRIAEGDLACLFTGVANQRHDAILIGAAVLPRGLLDEYGATRGTMNRAIRALDDRMIIEAHEDRFIVLDLPGLAAYLR